LREKAARSNPYDDYIPALTSWEEGVRGEAGGGRGGSSRARRNGAMQRAVERCGVRKRCKDALYCKYAVQGCGVRTRCKGAV